MPAIAEMAPDLKGVEWDALATQSLPSADGWNPVLPREEDVAFIQYTSGSTSDPKGVVITQRHVLANEAMIASLINAGPDYTNVSWLPFYHDMGLIGSILSPLYCGYQSVMMSPLAFLAKPVRWIAAMSKYRGNVSPSPDFGYALATRKIPDEMVPQFDLSHWQVAYDGGEPVQAETLREFAAKFVRAGFRPEALHPVYGMAEATLIVSSPRPPGLRSLILSRAALEQHEAKPGSLEESCVEVVSCGQAMPGESIRIFHPDHGTVLADDQVGEICLQGPHVLQNYWGNDSATGGGAGWFTDADTGRFFRTGDLGFLHKGELFVTGRLKDLIILNGSNLYPQDIERTVELSFPAVRRGCVVAFSVPVDGKERIVTVAEVERRSGTAAPSHIQRTNEPDPFFEANPNPVVYQEVVNSIRESVRRGHEQLLTAVVLLKAGQLPKTSSGKVQRQVTRRGFLEGTLDVLHTWRDGQL
jgi:acyl-CoA synthetase (AMP-forming)/AMP-acid ligase II